MKELQDSKRVLVVDDDIFMRMLLSLFLRRCGVTADVVSSVEQAILRLAANSYSLLLVDGHLEDGTGADIAAFARRESHLAGVPIIAISGDTRKEHIQKLLAAGANQFIRKPVTGENIRHVLEYYSLVQPKTELLATQTVPTQEDS